MPDTYKRITTREWDSTNTPKAIEAMLQNKLPITHAAKKIVEKKSSLAYLVKKAGEDGIDKAFPCPLALVHKGGWMTSANFLQVLTFFQKNTRCSKDYSVSLIVDNHESHHSVEALDFAKENGIAVLAWDRAAFTQNIKSGVRATEISPFDTDASENIDFISSFVSDRDTHSVASTSADESTFLGVATVNTTNYSAQTTQVSPQESNFPVSETSTAAFPA
ncbi:hypothetical protein ILUMI_22170 [Ignelater luminosus]|uniref:DDE-1 domain-containing protein n=1 Tax=Ignelater luminosus TaxID=2038154 RepID=A0A8K0G2V1_IGNLU|nr:hypothetical protein ILUMI_22170 [Ignelater luminosus]